MKIWLDDLRPAPAGWTWAITPNDFSVLLDAHDGEIEEISFDHDLGFFLQNGGEITGYTCLCWIEKRAFVDPGYRIPKLSVHSANPVAQEKMRRVIEKLGREFHF